MDHVALAYHHATKHDFNRFARSLGYLDWATQPDPFRRYAGAPVVALPRAPLRPAVPYSALYGIPPPPAPAPVDLTSVGELLRCSMGLSAWKQAGRSRWALRVNPSSGNLHPTEAYVVWNGQVSHYAPREHALEVRTAGALTPPGVLLVGLTSVVWREAWKYGERAFRYCQHDVGHAIGALRFAGALLGWKVQCLADWADADVAALLGVDRDGDRGDAEREEPECLLSFETGGEPAALDVAACLAAARAATWQGTANTLSPSRVDWPAIDRVVAATRTPAPASSGPAWRATRQDAIRDGAAGTHAPAGENQPARAIMLQRRSAVAFDARSALPRAQLLAMLERLCPASPPWDVLPPAQVQLAVFVHRVDGLAPGLYAYLRDRSSYDALRAAMRPEFLWEPVTTGSTPGDVPRPSPAPRLFLLVPADVRGTAARLSCDQDIASDGFFSLGMLAPLASALHDRGEWAYRRLFWECGLIGQVLYLEAEAAGARATGIGCFYDDRVHELLGLQDAAWQSLYHLAMGVPVDDDRLTTGRGYDGDW